MSARVLVIHVIAMDGYAVAWFPVAHRSAHAQHHTCAIAAQNVIRQVVAFGPRTLARQSGECTKRADRFKNCAPHCVEIDAAGHDRHECFIGCQFRHRHLAQLDALARVFVARGNPGKHVDILLFDHCRAIGGRDGQSGKLLASCPVVDGVSYLIHE